MTEADPPDGKTGPTDPRTSFTSSNWGADSDASETLGDHLNELAEEPFLRLVAARSLGLMRMGPGHRVLEAGCGTGVLLAAMARAVGPTGSVVGLDHNPVFLSEARKRIE